MASPGCVSSDTPAAWAMAATATVAAAAPIPAAAPARHSERVDVERRVVGAATAVVEEALGVVVAVMTAPFGWWGRFVVRPSPRPRTASAQSTPLAKNFVDFSSGSHGPHLGLDHGTLEEPTRRSPVEPHGVGEGEAAKVVLGHELSLHRFVGLGKDPRHLGHVPVADVGAEDGLQLGAEGIGPSIEGGVVHGVVGLAPEEEGADEALGELRLCHH